MTADVIQVALDAINNAQMEYIVKEKHLLRANKTNAIIVDGVIYPKGTYARICKLPKELRK